MLVVETIAKIRRAYFSLGKPIKEICRDLHVSRKVVRKVIRSDATEFHYERSTQPLPQFPYGLGIKSPRKFSGAPHALFRQAFQELRAVVLPVGDFEFPQESDLHIHIAQFSGFFS